MRFTLDELVEIELIAQEAEYRRVDMFGNSKAPTSPPLTREQITAQLCMRLHAQHHFSMAHVVTGARRHWKRNRR